jgi:hypothetical protein
MPVGQAEEMMALALVFVVHVVGAVALVWALLDGEQRAGWRNWPRPPWGRGDDAPPDPRPEPPAPSGARTPPDLPLPVSAPSGVRLREPLRAADGYPRPGRRPEHEPQRAPVPARPRPRGD